MPFINIVLQTNYILNIPNPVDHTTLADSSKTSSPDLKDTLAASPRISPGVPHRLSSVAAASKSRKSADCPSSTKKILWRISNIVSFRKMFPSKHDAAQQHPEPMAQPDFLLPLADPVEMSSSTYNLVELEGSHLNFRPTVSELFAPPSLPYVPADQLPSNPMLVTGVDPEAPNWPWSSPCPFTIQAEMFPHSRLVPSSCFEAHDDFIMYSPLAASPIETQTGGYNVSCSTALAQLFKRALQYNVSGSMESNLWCSLPDTGRMGNWLDANQVIIDQTPRHDLNFTELLTNTSEIDQALGPWVRSNFSEHIQALNFVVIENLLSSRFGRICFDTFQVPNGSAWCGLWFLQTLGAVLNAENSHHVATGSQIPTTVRSFMCELKTLDQAGTYQRDIDHCELGFNSGAIHSHGQLQLQLLATTAKTYLRQIDTPIEITTAMERSRQYFSLVSFLIEKFAPIDPAISASDTIANIRTALDYLRHLFTSEILVSLPFAQGALTTQATGQAELPLFSPDLSNISASQLLETPRQAWSPGVISLPDPGWELPSLTSSATSSPVSVSPATPTFSMPTNACPKCPKTFQGDSEVIPGRIRRHLKSSCRGQEPHKLVTHLCGECGRIFKRSDTLLEHERDKHPQLNRPPKKSKKLCG